MLKGKLSLIRGVAPLALLIGLAALIGGCGGINNNTPTYNAPLNTVPVAPAAAQAPAPRAKMVKASWYGPGLNGHVPASGEKFNSSNLTAASTTLPLGSVVK